MESNNILKLKVDRIICPATLDKAKLLICKSCKKVIGTFYIYDKEKRPAYRLYQDAVIKKIVKAKKL